MRLAATATAGVRGFGSATRGARCAGLAAPTARRAAVLPRKVPDARKESTLPRRGGCAWRTLSRRRFDAGNSDGAAAAKRAGIINFDGSDAMGLLTQILGGLAGRAGGGSAFGGAGGRSPFGGGGGTSGLLMSLLPVVLSMLANRSSAAGPGAGGNPGGSLGSVLGGMFGQGGAGGGAGGNVLGSLVERFTQRGYGAQAASWVGTGENQPLPPQALDEVFGEQALQQIAQQAGVGIDDARSGLSQLLPEVVDHFTPQGELPPADQFSSTLGDMLHQFEQR